jgi:hypothetical protein
MTDILKAIALTCGVLLLASVAYLLLLFWLTYVSDGNLNPSQNSPERIQMQTTPT